MTTPKPKHFSFAIPLIIALAISFASKTYAEQIDAKQLSEIVKVLASDEFEGRAPGGPGEEKTIAYLVKKFEALGLMPGGEHGSWTQAVPLIHTLYLPDGPQSLGSMLSMFCSLWFVCCHFTLIMC